MLFAHLSETEKHKYLMAVCFVMSQGIRNKSRARKKVKIKIVNYRGPKKDRKISCIFLVKVFASLFFFIDKDLPSSKSSYMSEEPTYSKLCTTAIYFSYTSLQLPEYNCSGCMCSS